MDRAHIFKHCVFVLFACFAIGCKSTSLPPGSDSEKFNDLVWRDLIVDSENVVLASDRRQGMLQDLVANHLVRKSKTELVQLLGSSDYEKFKISKNHLIYVTGFDREGLFPIDSEWLVLYFDDSDVYKNYEIRVD